MTQYHDNEYLNVMDYILEKGTWKQNRTGTRTQSVFGVQMRFDLRDGTIPLLTTKQIHIKSVIHELLWYLMGDTNIKYLQDNGVRIWNEWADENGNLGPVYGVQWRKWNTHRSHWTSSSENEPIYIDQIALLVDKLRNNPDDRRMIVSAWNVADIDDMALPPCHYAFQCYVADGKISMILNQRSCDLFLGVPFNIVQYSILLRMLCEVTGLSPGEFIWNGGDVHIYENHIEQCNEQLSRTSYPSPTLRFARSIDNIDDFRFEDFIIEDYQSHPKITASVAV